ncbi:MULTISPECIES: Gfo/Idh/MocA family protein [unclassified Acidisoma]|jgi:predicted dehydrogenase|uniref:Gfo/Idh/MocA family protein n=1 Tax=unclassified Acidisoma TaxID=2634065 RepID=UPI00131B75DB|nr:MULTISPECIES: Gfo/Idh/MocA family oxidoreductase [unclassified Acidisoma]
MSKRLKVGVVGCGLVAQVMHLHYLRELSELFEIAAICDVSESVRAACAKTYGVTETFRSWEEMLRLPLDAVFVLSSGSHAPIAIAAAEAGMHVLVEKPMCFSVAEGHAMIVAAQKSSVTLMVAYNKRYDLAYLRLLKEREAQLDLRLIKVTTLESPIDPYIRQYPLHKPDDLSKDLIARFAADNRDRITAAIGETDELCRRAYHLVLLDSMVHEFNTIRGIMGEPDRLEFADIQEQSVTAVLRFGPAQCVITWVDLPGIARYQMEFAFYAPDQRLTLSFPSPFVRNLPTLLSIEGGEPVSGRAWRSEETTSFTESFKNELIHFHECATTGRAPTTSGEDALRDIALCGAIIEAHRTRVPRDSPTFWNASGGAA